MHFSLLIWSAYMHVCAHVRARAHTHTHTPKNKKQTKQKNKTKNFTTRMGLERGSVTSLHAHPLTGQFSRITHAPRETACVTYFSLWLYGYPHNCISTCLSVFHNSSRPWVVWRRSGVVHRLLMTILDIARACSFRIDWSCGGVSTGQPGNCSQCLGVTADRAFGFDGRPPFF